MKPRAVPALLLYLITTASIFSAAPPSASFASTQTDQGYQWPVPPSGPIIDINSAPVVVVGTAGQSVSYWSEDEKLIWTLTTFLVNEVQRGEVPDVITVRTPGGTLPDGRGQWTEHAPEFKLGERSRLFLEEGSERLYFVVGMDQGKQDDPTYEPEESPTSTGAGQDSSESGEGDAVDDIVDQVLGEGQGYSYDQAPTQCNSQGQPGYCTSGYKWKVTDLPAHYRVNPNFPVPSGDPVAAINAAFQTWENDPGSYMDYYFAGTTALVGAAADGENRVYWVAQPTPACGGANNYVACMVPFGQRDPATGALNIVQFDIEFNGQQQFSVGAAPGRWDVQSIALHESGHALGLGHVTNDSAQIMSLTRIEQNETEHILGQGDIDGLRVLYTNHNAIGTVDAGNCNIIGGWAYDPDQTSVSIEVHIYIDGVGYNTGPTTGYRPDVNTNQGISGSHGFTWSIPTAYKNEASHSYVVYAINIPGGGANTVIGSGSFGPCNQLPVGSVDTANCNYVAGWAYDPNDPSVSIPVHVYIDGVGYNTGPTTGYRPDVNAAFGISGFHGYTWPVPSGWSNGSTHSVTVYAINTPSGSNPVIGTRTIGPCYSHATNGQLLVSDSGGAVYLTHAGTKYPYPSGGVFDSYSGRLFDGSNTGTRWDRINRVHDSVLNSMPTGNNIGHREGTLLRSSDGNIWIVDVVGEEFPNVIWTRRWVDPSAFGPECGLQYGWVRNDNAVLSYLELTPGVSSLACALGQRPDGQLINSPGAGIQYIRTNVFGFKERRGIPLWEVFTASGFNSSTVIQVSNDEANRYGWGLNIWFDEGSLIRNSATGLVANMEEASAGSYSKRGIPSGCTFAAYGFKWEDVVSLNPTHFGYYPMGPDVAYVC